MIKTHKKWLAAAALAAFAGTASAQDPLGNLVVTLDAFAINLNTAAQSLLADGSVSDGVLDGAFAVQTLLSDLATGTPLEDLANDNLTFIGTGTGAARTLLLVVDDLAKPVLTAGGDASPFKLVASGANLVLGSGFPILGSGLAGNFGDGGPLGFVQLVSSELGDDPVGSLLAVIGPMGSLSGLGFSNGFPLSGLVNNPANIPVLGGILGGGLLSGDSFPGMGFPGIGLPVIPVLTGGLGGGLLGSTGGIPVIGGLLGGSGGIPVIGGLLGGSGGIPVIGGLLGGTGGIPVIGGLSGGSGGIPVIGGLLGGTGGIPVIGGLLGGSGGIPVIGGLLGGTGGIPIIGSLPLDALNPAILTGLLDGLALPGLGGA